MNKKGNIMKIYLVYKKTKTNKFHQVAHYYEYQNAYTHTMKNIEYRLLEIQPTIADLSLLRDKTSEEINELKKLI